MMTDDYNTPQEGLPSEYRWNMVGKIPENVEMVFRLSFMWFVICKIQQRRIEVVKTNEEASLDGRLVLLGPVPS